MATNLPHHLTYPTLSAMPSNSFRVRKVSHYASDRTSFSSTQTRRININAPPNWYLLGSHSTVEFTIRGTGTEPDPPANNANVSRGDADPVNFPFRRWAIKWGAGYMFSRVRESLNAGSYCIDAMDDRSIGSIMSRRGWCSRRDGYIGDIEPQLVFTSPGAAGAGILADTRQNFINTNNTESGTLGINSLDMSGYTPRNNRSKLLTNSGGTEGIAYSVPLTAYSRLAQQEFCPVGLMGAFSTEAWTLEFTAATIAAAISPPSGTQTGATFTAMNIINIRVNATYLEVLDPDVQDAIERLFKKEDTLKVGDGRTMPLMLELPFINYSYSSHILPAFSLSTVIRINSNTPSARGILLVDGPAEPALPNDGDTNNSTLRWTSIKVVIGGHCIMECPYVTDGEPSFPQIESDLWTEYQNGSHLFSLYSPERDALSTSQPMTITNYNYDTNTKPKFIVLSFENTPHFSLTESELTNARGVDLRNVGQIEIHLKYESESNAPGQNEPIQTPQNIYAVLAHDTIVNVDRSGVHDITQSSL